MGTYLAVHYGVRSGKIILGVAINAASFLDLVQTFIQLYLPEALEIRNSLLQCISSVPNSTIMTRTAQSWDQNARAILGTSTDPESFLGSFQILMQLYLPEAPNVRERLLQSVTTVPNFATVLQPFCLEFLPPLIEEWDSVSSQKLASAGRITSGGFFFPSEDSLVTLRDQNPIHTEVIQSYLFLISRDSNATILYDPQFCDLGFAQLAEAGQIFLPLFISNHWSFLRLIPNGYNVIVQHITSRQEPLPSYDIEVFFPDRRIEWQSITSPQQRDPNDSGLFTIIDIRLMASGSEHLSQPQADEIIPGFRKRVLAELLAGALNPTLNELNVFQFSQELPTQPYLLESNVSAMLEPTPYPLLDWNLQPYLTDCDGSDMTASSIVSSDAVQEHIKAFANAQFMMEMLAGAVRARRIRKSAPPDSLGALWLSASSDEISQHAFFRRYGRAKFAQRFSEEQMQISPKLWRPRVMADLHLSKQKDWKALLRQVQSSRIWIEVSEVGTLFGVGSSVALCACGKSTSSLEALSKAEGQDFITGIKARLSDPNDDAKENLETASALADCLVSETFPGHALAIETCIDLGKANFKTVMDISREPQKLILLASCSS